MLLQNYMFERFLERLSLSEYKDKFVVKGGMLIASIVGMDIRSTMDLDITLQDLALTVENIEKTITAICEYPLLDNIIFSVRAITPIRSDDVYGGYRIKLKAVYDSIEVPCSIDISTGDVITPTAVKHTFNGIFDEDKQIEVWAYNIETIIAEKIETILSRSTLSTRPRDYYDIYILNRTQEYDTTLLREAVLATAAHRNTKEQISDVKDLLNTISNSLELKQMWEKYRREFNYANLIQYDQVIKALDDICAVLI